MGMFYINRIIKFMKLFMPINIFKIIRGLFLITQIKDKTAEIQSIIHEHNEINTYLEIGVEKGFNIIKLAKDNSNVKFIGVDPYTSKSFIVKGEKSNSSWSDEYNQVYEYFKDKSRKIKNIDLIRDYSSNAVKLFKNESLDFVFIDGAHDYTSVVEDINLWLPKVKNGGILGGHDYSLKFFGVIEAVNDTIGYDKISVRDDNTWFYFKVK